MSDQKEKQIEGDEQIEQDIQLDQNERSDQLEEKIEEDLLEEPDLQDEALVKSVDQVEELPSFIETKAQEFSSVKKVNSLQGVNEASPGSRNRDGVRANLKTSPDKAQAARDGARNHEYVDEFLGSYKDLGIVEDDAPGTDSYRDDEYEMIEEENAGNQVKDGGEDRAQIFKSKSRRGSKVGSGLIGSSGETNKEGIVVDQVVTESNEQGAKQKVDLDDEASIPDMRVNKKRSSTLEERNSSQTREHQSNASTLNGTNKKLRLQRPDDKQRRSQSRPGLDTNQLNLSMRKDSSSVLSRTQQFQNLNSVEQQELFNQSPKYKSSSQSQKVAPEQFQIQELENEEQVIPEVPQDEPVVPLALFGDSMPQAQGQIPAQVAPIENQASPLQENNDEAAAEITRITEESLGEKHSISVQRKQKEEQSETKVGTKKRAEEETAPAQSSKVRSKNGSKVSKVAALPEKAAAVLNSKRMSNQGQSQAKQALQSASRPTGNTPSLLRPAKATGSINQPRRSNKGGKQGSLNPGIQQPVLSSQAANPQYQLSHSRRYAVNDYKSHPGPKRPKTKANSRSSDRKAIMSSDPAHGLSDPDSKPLNIQRNNSNEKSTYKVDYFSPTNQQANTGKQSQKSRAPSPDNGKQQRSTVIDEIEKDEYAFDINNESVQVDPAGNKAANPSHLKKQKQKKSVVKFQQDQGLVKGQDELADNRDQDDIVDPKSTESTRFKKSGLSKRQSLKIKSRAQMLISQAQKPVNSSHDFRVATADMSSFTNHSSKLLFKPVLSQNHQSENYGFRYNHSNSRSMEGLRVLRSAQGQSRPPTMPMSIGQQQYAAMSNGFVVQSPFFGHLGNQSYLLHPNTGTATPQSVLDQPFPLYLNPTPQQAHNTQQAISRTPQGGQIPFRRIRSGVHRRQQQPSMSSVGGDGTDSVIIGLKNMNNMTDVLANADDASSLFGGHQSQPRKSVSKRRLKSANIYSQKIKMYNPNMLIFTPNQMFQNQQHQQQHLQTYQGLHSNNFMDANQQAPRSSVDATVIDSTLGYLGAPEGTKRVDSNSMESNFDRNSLRDRFRKRHSSEIEKVVQQMQNISDFDGVQLSPESLLRIGQRGIQNGVLFERAKHRNKANAVNSSAKSHQNGELRDQLNLVKYEMQRVKEQNLKLKTKNQQQEQKLKRKEKFIDELIKQSYIVSAGLSNSQVVRPVVTSKVNTGMHQSQDAGSPKLLSPSRDFDDEQRNLFRKHFIEKGPFNLLKMKKQINDFQELVQSKNQEIEELKHNIKSTKLAEAQEELLVYQKECLKLRYLSEMSICLLLQNGLFNKVKSNKKLNSFLKTINWEYFGVKNAISDIHRIVQEQQQTKDVQSNDLQPRVNSNDVWRRSRKVTSDEQEEQKVASQGQKQAAEAPNTDDLIAQKLQFEKVLNKASSENKMLKEQIAHLQLNLKKQQEMAARLSQEKQRLADQMGELKLLADQRQGTVEQQRREIGELQQTIEKMKLSFDKQQEKETPLPSPSNDAELSGIKQLNQDLQNELEEQKKKNNELQMKLEDAKQKLEKANKIKKSPVKFEENIDIIEKDKRIKELEQANRELVNELNQSQTTQIQRNKELLEMQSKMQELQRETSTKQFEIDRLNLLLTSQAQLQTSQGLTTGSQEPQEKDDVEQRRGSAHTNKDSGNQQDNQINSGVQQSTAGNQNQKKVAPTIQIPPQDKVNKYGVPVNNHYKSQSSQLMEELQNIEDKLKNLDIENLDERSDIVSRVGDVRHKLLSQKSFFENKSNYAKSPTRLMRKATYIEKYSEAPPQIIEEDVEYEQQLETVQLQKQIEIEQRKEREAALENEKKKRGFLKHAGKAQSNIDSESILGYQRTRFDRQQTKYNMYQNMNKQIDQINDTSSIFTEDISNLGGISQAFEPLHMYQQKAMQATFYVKREDPQINMVFGRLKTMLQIKRISIDQILSEMFSFENGKKIFGNLKLCEIAPLFMNRLGLQLQDATRFARFLVEEKDDQAEQDPDNAKIMYDPNRKVNLQMLDIRLQLHAPHVQIFSSEQELKAREEFTKAFAGQHIKFIRLVQSQAEGQDDQVINFEVFTDLVHQIIGKQILGEKTIECAYVFLCRPCAYNDVKLLVDREIAKAVGGFESKNTFKLFTEIDDDSSSAKGDVNKSSGRINSVTGSSVRNHPRLNLKKTEKQKDSDTHERGSADSQNAVTPFLGGAGPKKDTMGFSGMTNQIKAENSKKSTDQAHSSKPSLPMSRVGSQDKESKDKSSKDKPLTDELEENYDDNVAPLPGSEQFEKFQRSLKKRRPQFNFKDDAIIENQAGYQHLGTNFADQVIQYDKLSQQNSAVNQQLPPRPRMTQPLMRTQTQKFEQTGKRSSKMSEIEIIPEKIYINENVQSSDTNEKIQQELNIGSRRPTEIRVQNLDGQKQELRTTKDKLDFPYNENLNVTKNMEALYSEARSETDFDMQESMCRKSSYVMGMQFRKQQTQQSQITSNHEKNLYNKHDKEIIRQQAIQYQQSTSQGDGTFNLSHSNGMLNVIKQKSMTQQQEAIQNETKIPQPLNQTQQPMDNTISGNSKIQGITDGTSTTMEKKAFVDTIKEEIQKKKVREAKQSKNAHFGSLFDKKNQQKAEAKDQVNLVVFSKKNEIFDKLQSKVAKTYQTYQRAITFNKHCQEMLNKSDEDGEDSLEEQYQQDLEESLAQQKMQEQLDEFAFGPLVAKQTPTPAIVVDQTFQQKVHAVEAANLDAPDPTSHRQLQSAAGVSRASSGNDLRRQAEPINSQFNHDGQVNEIETPTTNKVWNKQNVVLQINKSPLGKDRTRGRDMEESESPRDVVESRDSAPDPVLSIAPLGQERPGKEILSVPSQGEAQRTGSDSLRDPYIRNLTGSQQLQTTQGTPVFNQKDLQSFIPENSGRDFKKLQSQRTSKQLKASQSIDSSGSELRLNSTNPKQLSQMQPPTGTGSANSSSRQVREGSAIEPIVEEEQIEERSAEGTELKNKEGNVSEAQVNEAVESEENMPRPSSSENRLELLLQDLIKNKLDKSMQAMSNMKSFQMIIDVTGKLICRMAKLLEGQDPNSQKLTVRELLKGKVFVVINKSTEVKEGDQEQRADTEVVQTQDILEQFNQLIADYNSQQLTQQEKNTAKASLPDAAAEDEDEDLGDPIGQNEVQYFMSVFQDPKLENLVPLDDLIAAFDCFDISEFKPISQEHMSFELLDGKSIRILKRFLQYLSIISQKNQSKNDFNKFMEGLMSTQMVKTKSSNAEVQLFSAEKFFEKLAEYGINKSAKQHKNLQDFLCIDPSYPDNLMYRKLKKCLQSFNKSRYIWAIDSRKRKIDLEKYKKNTGYLLQNQKEPASQEQATQSDLESRPQPSDATANESFNVQQINQLIENMNNQKTAESARDNINQMLASP